MYVKVSHPGIELSQKDIDDIEKDVAKIDRRLVEEEEAYLEIRLNESATQPLTGVTLRLEHGRTHLTANAEAGERHEAIRNARDELLRQLEDRKRGSHSDYTKHGGSAV